MWSAADFVIAGLESIQLHIPVIFHQKLNTSYFVCVNITTSVR